MNRMHRVVRASFYLALALPFAVLACGQSFTAGPGDGGEDGGIVFGDGGQGRDAPSNGDGSADARQDGDAGHDGAIADGRADGASCPPGSPTCSDGATGCDAGTVLCSGTCVDTTSNPQNCTGCGIVCDGGPPNSQPTCTNSVCGWACQMNYQECNSNTCLLSMPDPVTGVFVVPGFGTAGCGTESNPCGTITSGLQAMVNGKTTLYVAEGTYPEQITLPPGVTIRGGWLPAGWTRDCAFPPKTIIQAPAGMGYVVLANYNGSSALETLTIANNATAAAATPTGGQSLYGVFAANAQPGQTVLTLTNVAINVNAGGAGGTGGQGPAGASAGSGCSPSDGADGVAGGTGSGATNGTYGASGYLPATGGQGKQGGGGRGGTAAPSPSCVYTYASAPTTGANCCDTGGSGCGACSGNPTNAICGDAGTNGCASGGSYGGYGGTGGGASIGIYAWNANVNLDALSITTGGGGNGLNGGAGGPVSAGSMGAPGAQSANMYSTTCHNSAGCPTTSCVCIDTPQVAVPGGSAGGVGGTGGTGGHGGGGAGGDSFCYFENIAGLVAATNVTCGAGPGGAGGNGNAAQGRSGVKNQ